LTIFIESFAVFASTHEKFKSIFGVIYYFKVQARTSNNGNFKHFFSDHIRSAKIVMGVIFYCKRCLVLFVTTTLAGIVVNARIIQGTRNLLEIFQGKKRLIVDNITP
jgi:hypothetical protein